MSEVLPWLQGLWEQQLLLLQDGDPELTYVRPSCSCQAFPAPLVSPLPSPCTVGCVKLEAGSAHLSLFVGLGCSTENFLLLPS